MTHSRNTLRWDKRETNQGKSQRWELWVGPHNEWVVKGKTGGWIEDKVKIMGWGGWEEDWPGDSGSGAHLEEIQEKPWRMQWGGGMKIFVLSVQSHTHLVIQHIV